MKIGEIVSNQATEVVTVPPTASLVTAANLIATHHRPVLVVCDPWGKLLGLIAKSDVETAIANGSEGQKLQTVSEIMSRDVDSCTPLDQASEVLNRMNRTGCRTMPVIAAGEVVALVEIQELANFLVESRERAAAERRSWTLVGWKIPALNVRG